MPLLRSIARWPLRATKLILLLACLATLTLWFRSRTTEDRLTREQINADPDAYQYTTRNFISNPAGLAYQRLDAFSIFGPAAGDLAVDATWDLTAPHATTWSVTTQPAYPYQPTPDSVWNRLGFFHDQSVGGGNTIAERHTEYTIPHWSLALATGLWPITSLALFVRNHRRHRHRRTAGLCPQCGYDLRATPTRCPECGAEPRRYPRMNTNDHE